MGLNFQKKSTQYQGRMKYENHQDLLIKFSGMPLNGGGEGFSKVRDVSPITGSNLENDFGTK